eukprot:TRINITY_DN120006_c0_g1_i1.p2 TRINITY_DN120006_c0_g1~~TRINITY_DN120006_c0_g1_i1.p2  ORF type:complete len:197 (+),score=24.49 TRINITY_DN120006_c0_g1_i1:39-593(+)
MQVEYEGFEDYTVSTEWEKFVSKVEDVLIEWMNTDLVDIADLTVAEHEEDPEIIKIHHILNHKFPFRDEAYIMSLHIPNWVAHLSKKGNKQTLREVSKAVWPLQKRPLFGSGTNKLQKWFGVDIFLLLAPASYQGRLSSEENNKKKKRKETQLINLQKKQKKVIELKYRELKQNKLYKKNQQKL